MMGFITGTDVEVTMEMIAKFQKEEQELREREAREKGIELPKEKRGSIRLSWTFTPWGHACT